MSEEIVVNGLYEHFKGGLYRVLCIGTDTETTRKCVVYKNINNNFILIRPISMFLGEDNFAYVPEE